MAKRGESTKERRVCFEGADKQAGDPESRLGSESYEAPSEAAVEHMEVRGGKDHGCCKRISTLDSWCSAASSRTNIGGRKVNATSKWASEQKSGWRTEWKRKTSSLFESEDPLDGDVHSLSHLRKIHQKNMKVNVKDAMDVIVDCECFTK